MIKILAIVLLSLPAASAQNGILQTFFPPDLKSYLELTDDQEKEILKANSALSTFRMGKLDREFQVQSELRQETAKQTPDPMALGLRYVELEAIRRELDAEQQKTVAAVQKVLTAPQKVKLVSLQQALSLYSTACSAVSQNLIQPLPLPGNIISFNPSQGSFASFLLGSVTTLNCSTVTPIIRAGDFTVNRTPAVE
jgi:hypothetical protein